MELPGSERPTMSRASLIMALYGALALAAVLISAGREDVNLYQIAGTSTRTRLLLSPLIGLGIGLAVVLASRWATYRFDWARSLHYDFRNILGPLTLREIFILALFSAVGEEFLFRGALQPWIGLWPQAVIFALLHVGPGARFLPWTVSAFVMGIAFGCIYQWTGDLGGAITAHFTINFLNLLFIARTDLPARSLSDPSPRTG